VFSALPKAAQKGAVECLDATISSELPTSGNLRVWGRGWRVLTVNLYAEISLIDDGELSVWQVCDSARMFELPDLLPKVPDSVQKGEAGGKDRDAIIVILAHGNIASHFVNGGVYGD
jgi:hypothetical protein